MGWKTKRQKAVRQRPLSFWKAYCNPSVNPDHKTSECHQDTRQGHMLLGKRARSLPLQMPNFEHEDRFKIDMLTNASYEIFQAIGDLGPFVKPWGLHFSLPVGACTTALDINSDWNQLSRCLWREVYRVLVEPCRESRVLFIISSSIQILPYFCILLQSQMTSVVPLPTPVSFPVQESLQEHSRSPCSKTSASSVGSVGCLQSSQHISRYGSHCKSSFINVPSYIII